MPRKAAIKPVLKTVKFCVSAPHAKSVYLVGEFNDWIPTETPLKMEKKSGTWKSSLKLKPGKYQYKFVVDGEWWTDPNCPDWVWNEHGTHNSVVVVD
jgi:1,4-alpha-glucan branching enzyme